MLSRAKLGLLLIIVFAVIAFIIPKTFMLLSDKGSERVIGVSSADNISDKVLNNYFMISWQPSLDYVKKYMQSRYHIDEVNNNGDGTYLIVSENKAAFVVKCGDEAPYLSTKNGINIWNLSSKEEFSYMDLPMVFGETIKEIGEVISVISETPLKFRNYISSVDANAKKIYFRNGNVLITHSWEYLKIMDWDSFIADLKIKTIYELYSNGKYFPISRER